MADVTEAFFTELGRRGHEPLLEKASGTLRIDLAHGKQTDRWLVAVEKGDVAVSRRNVRADCVMRVEKALFDRIVAGEANAMAALLRGAIGVQGGEGSTGPLTWFTAFQRLFPAPPDSVDERQGAGGARSQR